MSGFSNIPSKLTLAVCLALAVPAAALAQATPSPTATISVSNCNDSGPGSLRAAVASAANGATISLRALECRRLLLTSGAIQVPQDTLALLGPTRAFTIDGNQASPVFEHSGNGTLRLRAMSIANGNHEAFRASGGCIDSVGNLRLEYVRVHDCRLFDTYGLDGGGGDLAANRVVLYDSEVFDNIAFAPGDENYPRGGGIWAYDDLTLVRSRISGNTAQGGYGGGVYAEGRLRVRHSDISGNFSRYYGALFARSDDEPMEVIGSLIAGNEAFVAAHTGLIGSTVLVANTTISGNNTDRGGLQLFAAEKSVLNSTIVNNIEALRSGDCNGALSASGELHLESTIVARNTCDGEPLDILGNPTAGQIVGSDNLVLVSTASLPPDTISANPRLSPLADNGGRTRTHALWAGSPAVDMGNNSAGLQFDQRGPGFDRVNGTRADIGAYER